MLRDRRQFHFRVLKQCPAVQSYCIVVELHVGVLLDSQHAAFQCYAGEQALGASHCHDLIFQLVVGGCARAAAQFTGGVACVRADAELATGNRVNGLGVLEHDQQL